MPSAIDVLAFADLVSRYGDEVDRQEAMMLNSVRAVGLFSALGSINIGNDTDAIQTTGYDAVAQGQALYIRTTTTGEKPWRKQSADGRWWELAHEIPDFRMFGASTTSSDNSAAMLAAFEWATDAGATIILPRGRFKYATPLQMPRNFSMIGAGWGSILDGPGLKQINPTDKFYFINTQIENLTLDGTDYTGTGIQTIGLDIEAANNLIVKRIKTIGYTHQFRGAKLQRFEFANNDGQALPGTRSGILLNTPATGSAPNLLWFRNCHYNWFNAPGESCIVVRHGLQHCFDQVQISNGGVAATMYNGSENQFINCDFEYQTINCLVCSKYDYEGDDDVPSVGLTQRVGLVALPYGNFFDSPSIVGDTSGGGDSYLSHLWVGANKFNGINDDAVFKGCATVGRIYCMGGEQLSDGGTLFDGQAVNIHVQMGGENNVYSPLIRDLRLQGAPTIDGIDTDGVPYSIDMDTPGAGLWNAKLGGVSIQRISARRGYFQPGARQDDDAVQLGAKIFSGATDPSSAGVQASVDGDLYIQQIAVGVTYRAQYLLWIKANGAWKQHGRPAGMRFAMVRAIYGWREGLRAVPRMLVANLIAMMAARRAVAFYLRRGRAGGMAWDKTSHAFPDTLPAE